MQQLKNSHIFSDLCPVRLEDMSEVVFREILAQLAVHNPLSANDIQI